MKISNPKLLIFVSVFSCTLILYYIQLGTSPPITQPKSDTHRGTRIKNIYEYQTVVGSAIESIFSTLKVHNCSGIKIPSVRDVQWNNFYWQKVGKSRLYLYSAYYDSRFTFSGSRYHYVRIISMSFGKIKSDAAYYCSMWYEDRADGVVVKAEISEVWVQQWDSHPDPGTYHTYIFTCPVPLAEIRNNGTYPSFISIMAAPCSHPTTLLTVQREGMERWQEKGGRRQFAVCVKGMDFKQDVSLKLIEWLELLKILGANQVFMYKYTVHENVEKVINYYYNAGQVKVVPLTLPGDQPNDPSLRSSYLKRAMWQKRRNELVPYNDCLYRNIYLYEYIIPLDIDEVIVPVKADSWSQMLRDIQKTNPKILEKYASLSVQNAYFLGIFNLTRDPSVPDYFHMLHHTMRSANFSLLGHSVKSFVATQNSRSVFNHYTLESLYLKMKSNKVLNTTIVQMNHYKNRCPREMYSQCKSKFLVYTKEDNILSKYKEELVPNVKAVIQDIGLMIS